MENVPLLVIIIIDLVILIGVGVVAAVIINRYQRSMKKKSEMMILETTEKAKMIELEARDKALKVLQSTEAETSKMRGEISREEERLQKRRSELDFKLDKMEQRDQAISKRQSALDKRQNEVEKLYQQQITELQRIGELTVEEARGLVLAAAEKEARSDMARIIRQVEARLPPGG
jgi:ribonuclease Y